MAWGVMPTEILEQIIIHATREKGDEYPPGEYRPEPSYRQFSSKAPFLESPKYKWLVAARNMANVCAHWRRAVLSYDAKCGITRTTVARLILAPEITQPLVGCTARASFWRSEGSSATHQSWESPEAPSTAAATMKSSTS